MRTFFIICLLGLAGCSGGISELEDRKINSCVTTIRVAQIIDRDSSVSADDKDGYCKVLTENSEAFRELAFRAVKDKLKDPNSAQFEDVKVFKSSVYGYVNAKNSYGAYGGKRRFRLSFEDGMMEFYISD